MYILLISIGMGGGVDGGVGVHTFMGEGNCFVSSVQWLFKLVRIAWHAHMDLVQASQLQGLL